MLSGAKRYKDKDGFKRTLAQWLRIEPGWAARRIRDCEVAEVRLRRAEEERNEARAKFFLMVVEVEKWKDASGLESGGDPDGVTPAAMRVHWEGVEKERDELRANNTELRDSLKSAITGIGRIAQESRHHEIPLWLKFNINDAESAVVTYLHALKKAKGE